MTHQQRAQEGVAEVADEEGGLGAGGQPEDEAVEEEGGQAQGETVQGQGQEQQEGTQQDQQQGEDHRQPQHGHPPAGHRGVQLEARQHTRGQEESQHRHHPDQDVTPQDAQQGLRDAPLSVRRPPSPRPPRRRRTVRGAPSSSMTSKMPALRDWPVRATRAGWIRSPAFTPRASARSRTTPSKAAASWGTPRSRSRATAAARAARLGPAPRPWPRGPRGPPRPRSGRR